MSETSLGLVASDQPNIIGPDFFSYYAREVADLVQGEDLLSFSTRSTDAESACKVVENGNRGDHSCAKPLFSDIISVSTSEVKKGSLKTVLRESVSTLTQEADETLDPIVSMRHELSQLSCKKQQCTVEVECKDKLMERPRKKMRNTRKKMGKTCKKMKGEFSSSAHGTSVGEGAFKSDLGLQVVDDEDRELLRQIFEKHAKEYALILHHMEKQLEAILEATTSQCRTMTHPEKQELKTYIQKLPSKNLERVAEIIFHNKPSERLSSDEIFVDLENEDNITLWRLYFYVKAVDNVRRLAQ